MKKNIILILVLIILVAIIIGVGIPFLKVFIPVYKENFKLMRETRFPSQQNRNSSIVEGNSIVYENIPYKYRVKYPQDWKKIEVSKKFVSFLGPGSDGMSMSILVTVELKQPFDLVKYENESIPRLEEQGFEVVEFNQITFRDNVAYKKIVIEKKTEKQQMIISTIINNVYYALTYTNHKNSFNKYLYIAQNFIDSFEIIE